MGNSDSKSNSEAGSPEKEGEPPSTDPSEPRREDWQEIARDKEHPGEEASPETSQPGAPPPSTVDSGVDLTDTRSNVSDANSNTVGDDQSDGELKECKRREMVMRVVVHTISQQHKNKKSGVDAFVEVRANNILLGATKLKPDNAAFIGQAFYIKTDSANKIKLQFYLKDQNHMTEDDLIGSGYFDLGEEDNTTQQKVHLKWKGEEIGHIMVSVDFQNIVVV